MNCRISIDSFICMNIFIRFFIFTQLYFCMNNLLRKNNLFLSRVPVVGHRDPWLPIFWHSKWVYRGFYPYGASLCSWSAPWFIGTTATRMVQNWFESSAMSFLVESFLCTNIGYVIKIIFNSNIHTLLPKSETLKNHCFESYKSST